jgi:hypothetical protein
MNNRWSLGKSYGLRQLPGCCLDRERQPGSVAPGDTPMKTISIDGVKTPILDYRIDYQRELFRGAINLYGLMAMPFFDLRKVESTVLRYAVRTKDKEWQATINKNIHAPALGFDFESVGQFASLYTCLTGNQLTPDCIRLAGRAHELVAILIPKVLQLCACDIPHDDGFLNMPVFVSEDHLRFDFYSRN